MHPTLCITSTIKTLFPVQNLSKKRSTSKRSMPRVQGQPRISQSSPKTGHLLSRCIQTSNTPKILIAPARRTSKNMWNSAQQKEGICKWISALMQAKCSIQSCPETCKRQQTLTRIAWAMKSAEICWKTEAKARSMQLPLLDRCPDCWNVWIQQLLRDGIVPNAVHNRTDLFPQLLWRKTATNTSRARDQALGLQEATTGSTI